MYPVHFMLISFCVSYPFSTPGSLEGLHLLLLSSGPLECGDQKGIDDPFSELIDMKRHLFGFRSGDDDDNSKRIAKKTCLKSIYIGFALRPDGKTI